MYVFPGPERRTEHASIRRFDMSVSDVCNHNVATIQRHEGIVEAAARMRAEHVGDLIVVEHKGGRRVPVGILTDRDIVVAVVGKRIEPSAVTVGDAMSSDVLKVRQDNGIEYALREMRRAGVRRAPVVDRADELVGVLSIDDVVDHLAVQLGHIADIVRLGQQTETDKRR
jgi:predicted transcriptional regulator